MGRMRLWNFFKSVSEKAPGDYDPGRSGRVGLFAIVALQHALLWSSLYVLGSETYLLIEHDIGGDVLVSAMMLFVAGGSSLVYLTLQNAAAMLFVQRSDVHVQPNKKRAMQWLALISIRLSVTAWLAACGLNVTSTFARQPYCSRIGNRTDSGGFINTSVACIVQRTDVGASSVCLYRLAAILLFILLHKITETFRARLFGIVEHPADIPPTLPCYAVPGRAKALDMSFNCRSLSSLSSHTLVASPSDSTAQLLPACPGKAVIGLGIVYGPPTRKQSAPSLLMPRPSLSSIRTHTTMATLPPRSPLLPLPAYFPNKYRRLSAIPQAIHSPRIHKLPKLDRSRSYKAVKMIPPSPILCARNLAAFNRSTESLSSVYSRSVSGEKRSSVPGVSLGEASRSYSSTTCTIVVRSPLGTMRMENDPDVAAVLEWDIKGLTIQ
ncbi:hypothetical protein BAUCODRAFT_26352 [Baudoinia panamericana UAMH 10762]|uniref:Uncharacterized protein n=1 Tax=Baudoinia panamericana (strain UAMH 10762) TaxID=717646 RepID=M2LIX9_BAUPA|nr:uncharacterized protein BAUCODRAFT_26352 [Baudoinia panamericana UAMH 10762]EMC94162.1 hypothetical protein BAUCODRAFT_26352 [Baudoinia panamericana UAMH 10762]